MIISMIQKKGGVGKSTVAIHTAVELASQGFSVGLLDTDSQRSTAKWLYRRGIKHPDIKNIDGAFVQGDLRDSIGAMSDRNDFLIIDTAGFDSNEAQSVLVNSHMAVMPFRPKKFDVETHTDLTTMLDRIKYVNPKLIKRVVLNQCPTIRNDKRADEANEFLSSKGFFVCVQRLYLREAYGDSLEEGYGVSEYDNAMSKHAKPEIKKLVSELTDAKK